MKKENNTYKPSKESKKWKDRFEFQERKLKNLHEDARKNFDILYATQTVKGMAPWKSKVYVPILASKAWDLIARMSDVVPMFNVTLSDSIDDDGVRLVKSPAARETEARIQAKLHSDYKSVDGEPMKFRVFNPLVDAVAAGTGYAYASWKKKPKVHKSRKMTMGDDGSISVNDSKVVTKTINAGKNSFDGVNFFNVFPSDDSNGDWQGQSYIIVRGYIPKYQAEERGWKDLDKAYTKQGVNTEYRLNNEARNRIVLQEEDVSSDDTVDMVTYYECFERDKKGVKHCIYFEGEDPEGTTMWVQAIDSNYPYWHNLYPIVPFYIRRKSYTVFGESLFENNKTLQSAVNDLFNHYLDNWNISIDSMIIIEDGTLTNDFIIQPGGQITYTGEKPAQWKFPEPNPTQLSMVMQTIEKGIEQATFSQYASGVPNSATDKTQGTAYGVKTITEAATNKIGFFRDNFKQSMKTVGEIWLANLRQFETMPQEVYREVNGREQPDIVMPYDYQHEAVVDIDDDSMVPLSKQEKIERHERFVNTLVTQQKAAIEQYMLFRQITDVPRVNWVEVMDDGARLHSIKDVDRYLLPNDVQPPVEEPADKETPEEKAFENITKKYDKASPDIKAQIEEKAGLIPSAMHDSELAHQAIKMGTEEARMERDLIIGGMDAGQGNDREESKQGNSGE